MAFTVCRTSTDQRAGFGRCWIALIFKKRKPAVCATHLNSCREGQASLCQVLRSQGAGVPSELRVEPEDVHDPLAPASQRKAFPCQPMTGGRRTSVKKNRAHGPAHQVNRPQGLQPCRYRIQESPQPSDPPAKGKRGKVSSAYGSRFGLCSFQSIPKCLMAFKISEASIQQ